MSILDAILKIRTSSAGPFTRNTALIGITAAVAGPFLLSIVMGRDAQSLPWYIWTITLLLLLLGISVGIYLSRRQSYAAEDISIRPRRH